MTGFGIHDVYAPKLCLFTFADNILNKNDGGEKPDSNFVSIILIIQYYKVGIRSYKKKKKIKKF